MASETRNPTTRKEACEQYGHRWHQAHLSEEMWRRVLEMLYDGHQPTAVMEKLGLPEKCRSSLELHARTHRGFIGFMRGVRLKDRRLAIGAALTEQWQALIERIYTIALDVSTKPGVAVKAASVAQKEMAELSKLAKAAIEEHGEDDDPKPNVEDVVGMVDRIAADVFGVRRDG